MSTVAEIRKAIDALLIQDIYLRESHLVMADDYDPKYSEHAGRTNLTWGPKKTATIEAQNNVTQETLFIWKVDFWARCRFLHSRVTIPQDESKFEPKDDDILATIESTFIAEYRLKDPTIDQESLNSFAQHNAVYHIWPYWREHIQNVSARALLPRTMLPMHVFKPPPNEEVITEATIGEK